MYRYNWETCRDLLKESDVAYVEVWRVILDVDNALDGESRPDPLGWLARLRRLRNRVAHSDSLARRHPAGGGTVVGLAIPGHRGGVFEYLAEACDQVHDLTEQMIGLAATLGTPGASTPPTTSSRARWNVAAGPAC